MLYVTVNTMLPFHIVCNRLPHTMPVFARLPRDFSHVLLNADLLQKRISNYSLFQITLFYYMLAVKYFLTL